MAAPVEGRCRTSDAVGGGGTDGDRGLAAFEGPSGWRSTRSGVGTGAVPGVKGRECWIPVPLPPASVMARTFCPENRAPGITSNGGPLRLNLWTGNVISWSLRCLFAAVSAKLWTALNQYGTGGPCATDVYGRLLGTKFENLSLGGELQCENAKPSSRRDQPAHGEGADDEKRTQSHGFLALTPTNATVTIR